jgi:hypothetical protein
MKRTMEILMLSCKKATELIDKKFVTKLSVKEKVMLRMHTSMCDACTAYQKQSKVLDELLHRHIHVSDDKKVPQTGNEDLKKKIISRL